MNEKIETMLKSGGLKLAAMKGIRAKRDAMLDAMRAEQARNDGEKLLSLVPAELHEYVGHDHRYIYVSLPGAAQVAAEYRMTTEQREYQGMSDLFIAEIWLKEDAVSGNVWSLWRYQVCEGDASLLPCGKDEYYKDIDVALARAVELGDGEEEAEKEAARQRKKFANQEIKDHNQRERENRKHAEDEVGPNEFYCPFMSKPKERVKCLLHECALFNVTDQSIWCSISDLADIPKNLERIACALEVE